MLARLYLLMPYTVTIREGEGFPVYEAVDGDYKVLFLPPVRDLAMLTGRRPESLTLDGKPAIEANVMRIDFQKNDFNRAIGDSLDPPEDVIQRAVSEYHARLRFTTRAAHAEPVQLNQWRLDYTNDDGSPLETREGYVRAHGTKHIRWSFIGLSREVWDYMFALPAGFEVPVWDGLRLDAQAALPEVGTAVVLAATSLEVFISVLLDKLASAQGMSTALWEWIRNRGRRDQEPSVAEQFDVLLKEFCGHGLKEEAGLWEAFKNIRDARNTFVHEGTAKIGGSIVTADKAAALIPRVNEIISKVREWIPENLRWPEPQINVPFEATHTLIERSNQAEHSALPATIPQ
jgi:hypothetical protein